MPKYKPESHQVSHYSQEDAVHDINHNPNLELELFVSTEDTSSLDTIYLLF